MRPICDLHTHSYCSDGTDSPQQLIAAAEEAGLSAVALTDHNCVDGLPEFLRTGAGSPVEAIPGAEFSVDFDGTELHLLGLFIVSSQFSAVTTRMAEALRAKESSNIALAEALNRAGYHLDYDQIKSASPSGKVNRAHFAQELTNLGYTQTVKEAFDTLLRPEIGYYQEPKRLTVWEMISFIRDIGAVPVLAHPFLNLPAEALWKFLPRAKAQGLAGMETAYSRYTPETTALAERMAREIGLLRSGGSDYHGTRKPDIRLGRGTGTLAVPCEWIEPLRAAAIPL